MLSSWTRKYFSFLTIEVRVQWKGFGKTYGKVMRVIEGKSLEKIRGDDIEVNQRDRRKG
jgi:hypothetical protein